MTARWQDHPALLRHHELLERWRKVMDLVGPGPLDPHFEDAVAATSWLDARGDWADLGSGAGFPGVALAALHPAARVRLVERRQKRCAFLEAVVAAAGLPNLQVVCGDADALPPGAWDGLVSRAFRPPEELTEVAARLLRPGGRLVLLLAREEPRPPRGWVLSHREGYTLRGHARHAQAWTWSPPPG